MAVESVLTFATEGILTKLTDLAAQEFRMAWGFKAELRKLSQSLPILQDFLGGAAEKAKDGGKAVEDWVKKLKDIADEADDVLEEINYEFLRRRVELQNQMGKKVLNFFSPSNPILFRLKMAHRIRKISASMAELKSEASYIGLIAKKKDATPQRIREDRETNAFIGKDEIIIGRKDVVSDIVTTLTNSNMNQKNLSVMAIAGMPGLGKTTLAKSVYNDISVRGYFEKRIWVCVSDPFNINVILICMLESLNPSKATVRENQDALLKYLEEKLEEKRYLLVLDDVWNEDSEKWERLMSCLSKLNSAPGSKIIVTTRSGRVASLTETLPRPKLDLVSTNECWSILKHAAYSDGGSDIPHDLERIGREIAKKCDGLPLMAKVLGGILRSKKTPAEWSEVKDSRIWDLPKTEDRIMPVLKLSFDNLKSPALKQCFSYCSTFMKDAEMERDDLIQLWMAQGFLHPSLEKSNLEMEDKGNEYFDILFQSSLFQNAIVDGDGIVIKCKMHDLVHDLAKRVSEIGSMMRDFHKSEDVATPIIERILEGSSGKLRSLFSNAEALPGNMLSGFKALRVLKLCWAHFIEELPSSIGELKHLRYLDISFTNIKRLPNSIGKLYNLQTLRATYCLEEFPEDVQNLINLRHVDCDEGTKFPVGVLGRLTSLRTLPSFNVGKEMGSEIEELAALNQLKGDLNIYNLEQVSNGDEARKAKLEEKKNVRHLKFIWSAYMSITNNNNEDVLEGLQPHSKLERLEIQYFMGFKFPSWLIKLDNLKQIKLMGCRRCEKVPTLGHLPRLTVVWIDTMKNLKCVGAEIYGTDLVYDEATAGRREVVVFPALEELHIRNCLELIEWMETSEQVTVFPCLEVLDIWNCPELRTIPSHFPSLKKLKIQGNEELTCLPKGMLLKIERMEIRDCKKLTCIAPDVFLCCASLRKLAVDNCPSLQSIPALNLFTSLRELDIENCEKLESLLSSGPVSVVNFNIDRCSGLQSIPDLNLFTCLRELDIEICEKLESLLSSGPISVVNFNIDYCSGLQSIPDLNLFTCLRELDIENCDRLESLVSSGPVSVVIFNIDHCSGLQSIPDLNLFTCLRELDIRNCERLESLVSSGPVSVVELHIWSCGGLQSIPTLNLFTSLLELNIYECERLESLVSSGLQLPASLVTLEIKNAPNLESLPSLDNLTSLCQLVIFNCENLKYLPTRLHCCSSLKTLDLGGFWEELDSFPDFHLGTGLSQLQRLALRGWPKLKSLPQQIQHFTYVTSLKILKFDGVEALEDWVGNLTSLTTLEIYWCKNLMYLPSVTAMQRLNKLQTLEIWECPLLEERCTNDSSPEWPKISHIPNIKFR